MCPSLHGAGQHLGSAAPRRALFPLGAALALAIARCAAAAAVRVEVRVLPQIQSGSYRIVEVKAASLLAAR